MKKLFLLALLACLFAACGDDDDEVVTTYSIRQNIADVLPNATTYYYVYGSNFEHRSLGNLEANKASKAEQVNSNISQIFVVYGANHEYRVDTVFRLEEGKKHNFEIKPGTRVVPFEP
ncbi:hypothetical protein M2132_000856 [Dysgonomonas sp. PH5-45]|uniref:hypothetical protein n=1 Tax=unclassified Dysgonomonas TaxID=2630389 RepID=UPI002473BC77|nr:MULTISPECIES: hypothetical protein [unclassified Dysgonomonas]MDH6354528.1 hypothetical protein [Dysgonomonas sp. PH5-45]MDH6387416.1 hypothetical protein [Dysgonomonas sp. PH5-37]